MFLFLSIAAVFKVQLHAQGHAAGIPGSQCRGVAAFLSVVCVVVVLYGVGAVTVVVVAF